MRLLFLTKLHPANTLSGYKDVCRAEADESTVVGEDDDHLAAAPAGVYRRMVREAA